MSIIVIAFLILITLIQSFIIYQLLKRKNRKKQSYSNETHDDNNEYHLSESDKVGKLQKEIKYLNAELAKFKHLTTISGETDKILVSDEKAKVIELDIDPQKKEFYLSVPENEMSFYLPDAVNSPDANSLFLFQENSDRTGTFEIYKGNPNMFTISFNSPEIYFDPICEYENVLDIQLHKSILTVCRGEFTIADDNVIIIKKIKIKFV